MIFDIVTLFSPIIEAVIQNGVIGQAYKKGIFELKFHNPRTFTNDIHRTVDDRPFGGGDGMVMLAEPWAKAIEEIVSAVNSGSGSESVSGSKKPWVVFLSPQGQTLDVKKIDQLKEKKHLVLICGRYSGLDQRVINSFVDEEISIGDYVLSGGELAAAVLVDSVVRQLPGVLGNSQSVEVDSFSLQMKGRLEAPVFTRPRDFVDQSVPEILLSGNHDKIEKWREKVSFFVTLKKRPDLLSADRLSRVEKKAYADFWLQLSNAEKESLGLVGLNEMVLNEWFGDLLS
jgi:tRNA (guanine37-N1)-methyltransferase